MKSLIYIVFMLALPGYSDNSDPIENKRLCTHNDSLCVTGVLEFPHTEGPHPAIVILHGAGIKQLFRMQ